MFASTRRKGNSSAVWLERMTCTFSSFSSSLPLHYRVHYTVHYIVHDIAHHYVKGTFSSFSSSLPLQ